VKAIKITGAVLGVVLVFVIACLVEEYLRARQRTSIPVRLQGDVQAEVTAYVQPDFLWAGEAWWIRVAANKPVVVDLDARWHGNVPAGTDVIFANNDANNTENFSPASYWKTPTQITVSSKLPQRNSGADSH